MKTRSAIWSELKADPDRDVLILGGGVNGEPVVLRDLALQGVRRHPGGQGRFCGLRHSSNGAQHAP